MKGIDVVWNTAVSNVGGSRNTHENFKQIADEFSLHAKREGFSEAEIDREVSENYEATALFMEED